MSQLGDSPQDAPQLATLGTRHTSIDVKISYKIIQLFSEGLYSSPNKAIEELVSNSFDAGAENVHVLMSPDLTDEISSIVVIDDGVGMDVKGLESHWIIGESNKRTTKVTSTAKRKQIGKFGIGKLATYVLASRLTHVSKVKGNYYITSMDYTAIPKGTGGGLGDTVSLDVRTLTEIQAKKLLADWIQEDTPASSALPLFGKKAPSSWTVSIMSNLKDMAQEIRKGRLNWVLATAMPIRSDFNLYLNGEPVVPQKVRGAKICSWKIGRGKLANIPKPASDEFEVTVDKSAAKDSLHHYGITHPQLGRVTGTIELYEDLLTQGKASELGRSHGFFVYVRGRLVNADDEYFGISSNKLKHGTFGRFRCEVHIDRLDDELRSSRETVRQTSLIEVAHNLLEAIFNQARKAHEAFEAEDRKQRQASQRVANSPASLVRTPLVHTVKRTLLGDAHPKLIRCPSLASEKDRDALLQALAGDEDSPADVVKEITFSPLGQQQPIAILNVATGTLEINTLHPYVAYFGDEFASKSLSLPLELFAASEVLLEATMYESGIREDYIHDVLQKRDQLLRELAKGSSFRPALATAQAVEEAAANQATLEQEVVAAFDSLGFDTVPVGGRGKRDGQAHTCAGGGDFSISIEARAKLKPGSFPTAATLRLQEAISQRDEKTFPCAHAVVVIKDVPKAAELLQIQKLLNSDAASSGKGLTLISVNDLARLVRIAPSRRIGLDKIREMFTTCQLPKQVKDCIDTFEKAHPSQGPYLEILEAAAAEQKATGQASVEYGQIETHLRIANSIIISKDELIDFLRALGQIVPEYVFAGAVSVELKSRPDRIMQTFKTSLSKYK